jgi:hypothetical protein
VLSLLFTNPIKEIISFDVAVQEAAKKIKELNAGVLPLIIACENPGWVWRKGYEN